MFIRCGEGEHTYGEDCNGAGCVEERNYRRRISQDCPHAWRKIPGGGPLIAPKVHASEECRKCGALCARDDRGKVSAYDRPAPGEPRR